MQTQQMRKFNVFIIVINIMVICVSILCILLSNYYLNFTVDDGAICKLKYTCKVECYKDHQEYKVPYRNVCPQGLQCGSMLAAFIMTVAIIIMNALILIANFYKEQYYPHYATTINYISLGILLIVELTFFITFICLIVSYFEQYDEQNQFEFFTLFYQFLILVGIAIQGSFMWYNHNLHEQFQKETTLQHEEISITQQYKQLN